MIHSLAGSLPEGGLLQERPFRDPHHSASLPALVGGGQKVKPGEISLAHQGILFLDELPEFARATLESLRQPLESGEALIARANQHVRYPANFQLIAAMNPCRCGHLGSEDLECTKAPRCAADYQAKISGPMLDRIDLIVDVPAVNVADLSAPAGEPSSTVAARVTEARRVQAARFAKDNIGTNAQAEGEVLETMAALEDDARALLTQATDQARFSARGYYRLLRVARTIADLDGAAPVIGKAHIAEALSYRRVSLH
jgi:magnesium chelatase family protein